MYDLRIILKFLDPEAVGFRKVEIIKRVQGFHLRKTTFTSDNRGSKILMTPDRVFSHNSYIEYIPGDLNVILSVPHGGHLKPLSIPNRDAGAFVCGRIVYNHKNNKHKDPREFPVRVKCDLCTTELAINVSDELSTLTNGHRPHVVINRLHRGKLDCNCDREKASFEVPEAEEAWEAFHGYIDAAKSAIGKRGLFLDLHGHTHSENWVELGYTVSKEDLNMHNFIPQQSSIANLIRNNSNMEPNDILSGSRSFGGMLAEEGYASIPSPWNPTPMEGNYYTGGYNTDRHGSKHGGVFDGIQVESPKYVRTKTHLKAYSKGLARTIEQFRCFYYPD